MSDSVSKIITAYFAALTRRPFTYQGRVYQPKELVVSPLLFRGFTCPSNCGGCCIRVTLDYLPSERQPPDLQPRMVDFDGRAYMLMSDTQEGRTHPKCRHLRPEDGRCNIHDSHPMPCDVELTKFLHFEDKSLLISKLYGRGWALRRVDGGRGSLCEMLPVDEAAAVEIVRKLRRLREWCLYFDLDSWIDDVIAWAEDYPRCREPLRLGRKSGLLHNEA